MLDIGTAKVKKITNLSLRWYIEMKRNIRNKYVYKVSLQKK